MKPDIAEFTLFHRCLMKSAPKGYIPSYLPLQRHSKVPVLGIGWKNETYRFSFNGAAKWMVKGGNIGIVGRPSDALVNVDLDGNADKSNLKPTLTTRSRSRTGVHGFYFCEDKDTIPNIQTGDEGEVRAYNQYVVCAGSFVPVDDPSRIPAQWRDKAGYYTVEDARPPARIVFDELPQVFKDQYTKALEQQQAAEARRKNIKPRTNTGKTSAVFNVSALDVVLREGGEVESSKRWGSIFHDSTTAANMSISRNGKYLHCWRHCRALNGLACLAVKSGVISCEDAGMPHKNSIGGNGVGDREILHAWIYAKQHGYIPEDDPVPVRALNYIAEKHLDYTPKKDGLLPRNVYREALLILEAEY